MTMAEHLSPQRARLFLERDRTVSHAERSRIDAHLVRCGECAGLCARIGGLSAPRTAEEASNVVQPRQRP